MNDVELLPNLHRCIHIYLLITPRDEQRNERTCVRINCVRVMRPCEILMAISHSHASIRVN